MFNGAVPFFILNLTFHFKIILCTEKISGLPYRDKI